MLDISYDEWGQARGAGGSQDAPLDKNFPYICGLIGTPILRSPCSLGSGTVPPAIKADAVVFVFYCFPSYANIWR